MFKDNHESKSESIIKLSLESEDIETEIDVLTKAKLIQHQKEHTNRSIPGILSSGSFRCSSEK